LVIPPNDPTATPDFMPLMDLIVSTIHAADWEANGGTEGNIQAYEGNGVAALAVSHNEEVLEEVEWLLANLRNARSKTLQEVQAKRPLVPAGGPSTSPYTSRRFQGGCVF
jgi:hypothetical protein